MRALDAQQETPASATGLIVEPKKEGKKEGAISFSNLLKGLKEDSAENSTLQTLLKGVDTKEDFKIVVEAKKVDANKEVNKELKESSNNKSSQKSFVNILEKGEELQKSTVLGSDQKILQSTEVEDGLASLLQGDLEEINPKLSKSLSQTELKKLAKDAKEYLKDQILSSDGFKRAEIDTLPKTLKGLTQAAQKLGIDLSKITFEEVQVTKETSKNINIKSDIKSKSTPLFNAQKNVEISTEQIVQTKAQNRTSFDLNTPKKTTNDTLELLLQGKKSAQKSDLGLTSDFSVATAKVIAPSLKNDNVKSLEALLNPDLESSDKKSSDIVDSKTTTLNPVKADSLEVKMNEAKQMVKYLSQDVKQAIDDYKAPFTRVKVQLNPQQLGEIELTVVQRGKNLHVNLSSNNAAINTLAMNANDLKVQLQNSGINNASLNFSNNSQGGDAANGGQSNPQQQNRQQAQEEYNYFDKEETNEEILSSLEIIVPNYA